MKQIIALQEYTDKFISLYEGQIRNIEDSLADKLIEEGIVAQHSDDDGSGGGSGVSFVKIGDYNGTFSENSTTLIAAAPLAYHFLGESLKQLLNESKTIIGFTIDCDDRRVSIYSMLIENDSFIVHQKEDGILDDGSKMLKLVFARTDTHLSNEQFTASIYAICI